VPFDEVDHHIDRIREHGEEILDPRAWIRALWS
jgi:hypothetical protein